MLSRMLHGVVPDENGRYVMVSLRMGEPEQRRLCVRQWMAGDRLTPLRLLHRGIYCGVPAFWKAAIPQAHQGIIIAAHREGFAAWAERMPSEDHIEAFSNNLLGLVPEDSYLCTVPFFFGDPSLHSFVSVHCIPAGGDRKAYFKIGVIFDKTLMAVFTLAPGTMDALESHLGRIRRFFSHLRRRRDFPEHLYIIGSSGAFSLQHFFCHPLSVKIGKRVVESIDELKALGCALTSALVMSAGSVPFFSKPPKTGALRHLNAALLISSIAIIVATALAASAPYIMNRSLKRELQTRQTQYRSLIMNNPVIQTTIKHNDSLAASILRMNAQSGQRTVWGKFLQCLGAERPKGLFYEKLGSEPGSPASNTIRIAISGFAQGETMVTDLISRLQKTGFISNITLTFMEKNKIKPNLCDFKIICTLMIIE
jgi:hypothetical protein